MDLIKKHDINIIEPENHKGTIIFANGFGTNQTFWKDVSKHFAKSYKVVLFENIGSAKSDLSYYSPNKYDNLNAYSRDLIEICDKLNLKNAIIVGHSVSGMIGLLASIKEPSLFSNLVLVGASPRYVNDGDYIGGFTKEDLDGLFEAMRTNYFAWASGFAAVAMNSPDSPYLSEYFASSLSEIQPDIAVSVAQTIFYSDHRKDLGKVSIPGLIIKTKEDIAVPGIVSDYLHSNIKGSKMVEVNAKGHFPHFSSPGEIIKAIDGFLTS